MIQIRIFVLLFAGKGLEMCVETTYDGALTVKPDAVTNEDSIEMENVAKLFIDGAEEPALTDSAALTVHFGERPRSIEGGVVTRATTIRTGVTFESNLPREEGGGHSASTGDHENVILTLALALIAIIIGAVMMMRKLYRRR